MKSISFRFETRLSLGNFRKITTKTHESVQTRKQRLPFNFDSNISSNNENGWEKGNQRWNFLLTLWDALKIGREKGSNDWGNSSKNLGKW